MRTAWLSVSVLCVVDAAAPAEAQSAAAGDGGPPAAVQPLVPEGSGAPQAGFSVGRSLRVEPRRVDRPPVVDGRLDEEVWLSAAVVDDFVQQEPAEGDPETERTVVRLLRDARALYLGVEAYDSAPEEVIATEMRQRLVAAPRRGHTNGRRVGDDERRLMEYIYSAWKREVDALEAAEAARDRLRDVQDPDGRSVRDLLDPEQVRMAAAIGDGINGFRVLTQEETRR